MNQKTTKSRAVKIGLTAAVAVIAVGVAPAVAAGPSQAAATSASVTSAGIVDIPDHAQRADLSGVTRVGDKLLIVNDRTPNKDVGQAVYTAPTDFKNGTTLTPMTGLPNIDVQKLEGITTTPSGDYVVATTAFDRGDQPAFNVLMAWPANDPSKAQILGSDQGAGGTSGKLRTELVKALGTPFIKIEGVAVSTDKIYLGVREQGPDFKQSTYVTKIVSVDYSVTDGAIKLGKVDPDVWKMSPSNSAGLKAPLGLSDLTFDAKQNRLLMTTSYEKRGVEPENVAGHLWELPVENISKDKPAEVVTTSTGSPLTFTHKPEGVVTVPGKGVMVLHDDDERLTTVEAPQGPRARALYEAAYDFVTIK